MSTALADFVDLSFRTDLGLLFSRWLRSATDAEVRQGYEAALAVATPHAARYWLLDMRRRGPASAAATRWVIDAFLPRLAGYFPPRLYLAYLLSPSHLGDFVPLTQPSVPGTYEVALFSDEAAALHWLERCRHAEAAPTPTP
ncbi:hypothetical protein LJ737_00240 [Hymenobacter sp. 15J16-1T3B]|uniref:hypothetical protein n=1 Tax=Hymenobacter sp. 15J16-1T3B TaxID=2886941 RepID=UPI001D106A75|nr:hypothetical protein [Hymenobacter sp. 15J16-1T3B]MCC3155645.1 hypothetical protein [Hymenobacter sp. 15J16-1T3B]